MTVGERIKARRESLNMSQGDLASIMNVSRQAISKAEHHDSDITMDKVTKFANALGCSEAFLMGWEEKPTDNRAKEELLMYFAQLTPEKQDSVLNLLKTML